ncbi:hypothetical protein TSOC_002620 [Tetrabaena socialis]|uniref:DNA-directed RNA polymerase n=1 Tax=Tetrabaena socialis TaxID=47790 RepID=A0A2J8ADS1_9CHLO|nr:hypothetical protein TSOC_002620 [Tetrabaena socialis]|eukprot:PNH10667.1 hypothetical protein TSOC_002620 [Tetrabaena socialis]
MRRPRPWRGATVEKRTERARATNEAAAVATRAVELTFRTQGRAGCQGGGQGGGQGGSGGGGGSQEAEVEVVRHAGGAGAGGDRPARVVSVGRAWVEGGVAEVTVQTVTARPLAQGDKVASRHGQKSMVGRLCPPEDTPRTIRAAPCAPASNGARSSRTR